MTSGVERKGTVETMAKPKRPLTVVELEASILHLLAFGFPDRSLDHSTAQTALRNVNYSLNIEHLRELVRSNNTKPTRRPRRKR